MRTVSFPAYASHFLTYRRISLKEPYGIIARYGERPGIRAITTKPWIIITLFRDCFSPDAFSYWFRHHPHNTCTMFPAQVVPDNHRDSGNVYVK